MAKKVQEMKQNDLGTIGGKLITQEMLDEFTADFERDWFVRSILQNELAS